MIFVVRFVVREIHETHFELQAGVNYTNREIGGELSFHLLTVTKMVLYQFKVMTSHLFHKSIHH